MQFNALFAKILNVSVQGFHVFLNHISHKNKRQNNTNIKITVKSKLSAQDVQGHYKQNILLHYRHCQ